MSIIVPRVVLKDFFEGEDPGFIMLRLVGADAVPITTATSWSLKVFDLTSNSTDVTTGQPGTFSGSVFTTNPLLSATLLTDAFWGGIDDIGYNFRHYVKASDFNAPALLGGHSYRFEYSIVTPAFVDGSANQWGTLVGVREGTCRELKKIG